MSLWETFFAASRKLSFRGLLSFSVTNSSVYANSWLGLAFESDHDNRRQLIVSDENTQRRVLVFLAIRHGRLMTREMRKEKDEQRCFPSRPEAGIEN